MRLLARYLLRECLLALSVCFSAFLLLWISIDLINELHGFQENKMRGLDIAAYYFYKVPEFLPLAIPMALLIALLYALTNHARHNEITAIRAAGVSLWRISLPYFSVAFVCGAALFVLNELVAPAASEMAEDVKTRRVKTKQSGENRLVKRNRDFTNSRDGRKWHIAVYNIQTGTMNGVNVDWTLPDGTVRSIFADKGVYADHAWTFYQVRESRRLPGPEGVRVKYQTNEMTFPEFTETPDIIKSEISISDRFGSGTRTKRADVPLMSIMDYLKLHPNPERAMKAWLDTKLHGRFAAPVTCIVVVLLAIPFGAASGRRTVFVGVAGSIVIFFAYYITQQLGFAFAEAGRIPAWFGAWFPNLLAGISGLWLMARVR